MQCAICSVNTRVTRHNHIINTVSSVITSVSRHITSLSSPAKLLTLYSYNIKLFLLSFALRFYTDTANSTFHFYKYFPNF